MTAGRILLPCMPALDSNGRPVAGSELNFYENNTTTQKAVYTTADLDVELTNPVVADGAGVFPSIFADSEELYSVTGFSPAGVMLPGASYSSVQATTAIGDGLVVVSSFMQTVLEAENEFEALLTLGEVYAEAYQLDAEGARILPAIQRAHDALPATGGVIRLRAGQYTASTDTVTITKPCAIVCDAAWRESPEPTEGAWISIDSVADSPFTITGTDAKGFMVKGLAFYQDHPAVGPGWTPTDYPPVIDIVDMAGGCFLDQLYFANINKWVSSVGAGRTSCGRIWGMPLRYGFYVDNALDACHFGDIHAWPFGYADIGADYGLYVAPWTTANADVFVLGRCDTPFIDRVFALGCHSVIRPVNTASGVPSKVNVNAVVADNCKYLVYDNDGADGFDCIISKATHQGLKAGVALATIVGARLIYSTSAVVTIQISEVFCEYHDRYDIESTGFSFTLMLGTYRSDFSNQDNGGYGHIKCTGASAILRVGHFDFQGVPVAALNDSASTAVIQANQPLYYAAGDVITRYRESYGTASRAVGVVAATLTTIAHGLGATPAYASISPRVNLGASSVSYLFVAGVDATNIYVQANATVMAADVTFFWEAKI